MCRRLGPVRVIRARVCVCVCSVCVCVCVRVCVCVCVCVCVLYTLILKIFFKECVSVQSPCGVDAQNTHYYLSVASNNTKTKLHILSIWHNILTRTTLGQQKLVDCRTISTPALVDTPGKN